jgi:thiamine biosynthesis lipoprotein
MHDVGVSVTRARVELRAISPDSAALPASPLAPRLVHVERSGPAMGGQVSVWLAVEHADVARGEVRAAAVLSRIRAWARLLTRFEPDSDLTRLNADTRSDVLAPPTLAAVLDWSAQANRLTDGVVDVTLLDARLAAEFGSPSFTPGSVVSSAATRTTRAAGERRRWSVVRTHRGATVSRRPGIRFDIDGTAKGWIADRALDLVWDLPGAIIDADGDVAVRVAPGDAWEIGIADPREPGAVLAVFDLSVPASAIPARFGVATSGVSVHRWAHGGSVAHHLIDPFTGRPADTDVVQATVLAPTAREAEAHAKTAVVVGSSRALDLLDRAGVHGAVLLTSSGDVLALSRTTRWLRPDAVAITAPVT